MYLPAAVAFATLLPAQPATVPFALQDGDRIVWIGSTLVEREQRYGYWETALHAAFPDKSFTFRNLGWSGDTVFGEARLGFDVNSPSKGFERLVTLALELKPTVIFVSYGTNESFEGEVGLPKFEKGLEKLLDALAPAKARVVLFTPPPFEVLPGYVTAAQRDARNAMLDRYAAVIREVSIRRGHFTAKLELRASGPITDNGMHLTGEGYKATSAQFLASLGHEFLGRSPDATESLREAVVAKNELFFHRWRPQNETYLFGFRKHEQGKNAKEVAEFDPLVAKAEQDIERIRKAIK